MDLLKGFTISELINNISFYETKSNKTDDEVELLEDLRKELRLRYNNK